MIRNHLKCDKRPVPLLERSLVLIPDRLVFNFSFGKFLKENFQFAAALQELPKPFQEGANKALRAIETDSYGDGDYRTESPEIQKYPRSQSSMAGKFHFIAISVSCMYFLLARAHLILFSSSLESDKSYMTYSL